LSEYGTTKVGLQSVWYSLLHPTINSQKNIVTTKAISILSLALSESIQTQFKIKEKQIIIKHKFRIQ